MYNGFIKLGMAMLCPIFFFNLSTPICAQTVDSLSFLNQKLHEVVINEQSLEFNQELLNMIEAESKQLKDEIRFYTFDYVLLMNDSMANEKIFGTFFVNIKPRQTCCFFEPDSFGFVNIQYDPDSLRRTTSSHIGISTIFWDNIIVPDYTSRKHFLEKSKKKETHTIKMLLNDSIVEYKTYQCNYSDQPTFVTKWDKQTKKLLEMASFTTGLMGFHRVKNIIAANTSYQSFYSHNSETGMIDSVHVQFAYKRDGNNYKEKYTMKNIPFDSAAFNNHIYTPLNKKLVYFLKENKFDAKKR